MKQYKDLVAAIRILNAAKHEAFLEVGSAFNNPAWDKLNHVANYLTDQAKDLL